MSDPIVTIDEELVVETHVHRRSVSCIPMFDRAVFDGSQHDESALLVAATWLWTRFDTSANAELVHTLSERGVNLNDPENLKEVDAVLRVASRLFFEEIYQWCLHSPYVAFDNDFV